ncbi:WecB/TagA/CpsF family glycosyltransferase [Candidatus Roizmanbacteria bacterium]|nr:MAG: WecB/TagA/CpsF family glycosyltransferase [Candidatus Roizmanbacteria bacterium]
MRNSYVFCHIVSLNPENVMIAQHDEEFRNILSQGDIQIVDGVGIALGGSILGIEVGERVTGVDLMEIMLKNTKEGGLHVLLLGGKSNVADDLAKCYQKKYSNIFFKGIEGISNIQAPKTDEERRIFSIVADYRPQIIFAAFGSPWQEKWFWAHKDKFKGIVCMGVGGGFDFALGKISRAPAWVRTIGMEWLFRLLKQPWRAKRQMRLFRYILLLIKARFGFSDN